MQVSKNMVKIFFPLRLRAERFSLLFFLHDRVFADYKQTQRITPKNLGEEIGVLRIMY